MSTHERGVEREREIDALLVRSIVRWSLATAVLMALFMIGVVAGYPYPDAIDGTRAIFYVAAGAVLVLAAVFISFLGYRLVTLRVITKGRTLYLIFLPTVMLISSVITILLLAAPS